MASVAAAPSGRQGSEDEDAVVRVHGLSKRFPLRRSWRETLLRPRQAEYQYALRDVTLDVARGEFFGLLGRNGAGKTTLFKILSTLILPDEGSAWIDGLDLLEQPGEVRRRLVPVIPYERSLYWRLSARENVRLYAALQGHPGAEAERRGQQVLELVGLADTGSKQVGLFSTGMRQRLLVARALLSDPDILLLDEPTRSLDPLAARDLRRFLREQVNERQGCTVLLATHDAEEVHDLCDRVGILEEGRLLATGTTEDLLRSVGQPRYELLLRGPFEPVLKRLQDEGALIRTQGSRAGPDGWTTLVVVLPDGPDAGARLSSALVRAGVEIAYMAPRPLELADLIESVVDRHGGRHPEAGP